MNMRAHIPAGGAPGGGGGLTTAAAGEERATKQMQIIEHKSEYIATQLNEWTMHARTHLETAERPAAAAVWQSRLRAKNSEASQEQCECTSASHLYLQRDLVACLEAKKQK